VTHERAIPGTVLVQSIFGPLVAFDGDHATQQIKTFGAHTRNEVALLSSFVEANDLVYDVGAHIGTFAIPLAKAAGRRGRLIAIEADPENFSLLQENLDRQGLIGRVTPLLALAGGQGLRYRKLRVEAHTSATCFMPDPDGEVMATLRLDDLQERLGETRRVAIIKADVEGMELAVLRSAELTIARDRPILYVEISVQQMARYAITMDDVQGFLRRHDYRFFRNVGDRNSSHDRFKLTELRRLQDGGNFYDVLAIPAGHHRLAEAVRLSASQ
jgi:FkbM family methyltransferase